MYSNKQIYLFVLLLINFPPPRRYEPHDSLHQEEEVDARKSHQTFVNTLLTVAPMAGTMVVRRPMIVWN